MEAISRSMLLRQSGQRGREGCSRGQTFFRGSLLSFFDRNLQWPQEGQPPASWAAISLAQAKAFLRM
eukprot:2275987-Amphidinium_carterae.1